MKKVKLYKALKYLFFLAGFPLLILLMIITMEPMLNEEILGAHARNWIIIFCAIWAVLLIVQFVLEKFVGKKSETMHKLVLVVMATLSIICVLVPSAIFDASAKDDYNKAYAKLENPNGVKKYESVMGWHRDFTNELNSEVYSVINANYDFMKMYGLSSIESGWYSNADKENNIGYIMGVREKAQTLLKDKQDAKAKLALAQAELTAIENAINEKLVALNEAEEALVLDPTNADLITARDNAKTAYDAILKAKEDDLVRLKGARVDITPYKEDLVNILVTAIKDPNLLPDGLDISIAGITLPVGDLLKTILNIAGGAITPEAISNMIPDVIYTGIGAETISTYESMVNGGDNDMSLSAVEAFNFKITYYPEVLAAGAVRYACYICVGIIVLSIFMTDYFARKVKEENNEI